MGGPRSLATVVLRRPRSVGRGLGRPGGRLSVMRLGRRRAGDRGPREVFSEWEAADEASDTPAAIALAEELLALTPDSSFSWSRQGCSPRRWAGGRSRRTATSGRSSCSRRVTPRPSTARTLRPGTSASPPPHWVTGGQPGRPGAPTASNSMSPTSPSMATSGSDRSASTPSRPSRTRCWRSSERPRSSGAGAGARRTAWLPTSRSPNPGTGSATRFSTTAHPRHPRARRTRVSVFDELVRLEDSGLPTWQAHVVGSGQDDLEGLAALLGPRGLGDG